MQGNCTNRRTLLHKFWERSLYLGNKVRRLVQFRCIFRAFQALKCTKMQENFSGPEMHEKCKENCTNRRTLLHKFWNVPKIYVTKYRRLAAIFLHFSCISGPEMHKKCKKISAIVVLCYINFGNVPKIYVTKYDDWCNFVAFFLRFRP